MGQRRALLVGISRFDDPNIHPLNAPIRDVSAFSEVLRDPEICNFDDVEPSLDEDYQAVRNKIARLTSNRDHDDLILLYYSGHGILEFPADLHLLTRNTMLDNLVGASFRADEIRGFLDRSRSRRQILILDCCYAGAYAANGKKVGEQQAVTRGTFFSEGFGRVVMLATSEAQPAPDGPPSADAPSPYTRLIVEALREGLPNVVGGAISAQALAEYVELRARRDALGITPRLLVDSHAGPLVMVPKARHLSVVRGQPTPPTTAVAKEATTADTAASELPASMQSFPSRLPLVSWRQPIPRLSQDAWPEMVTLPMGSFVMGAPIDEEGSAEDERPQRVVPVLLPFAIGRCPVTFAQWDLARAAGARLRDPEDQGWGRGTQPVINVSWNDARAYCEWLNEVLGLNGSVGYRLPSEAEWEYGCRAGTATPFCFGDTISTDQANYDGYSTYARGRRGSARMRTMPAGSFAANPWGLHEMHGNVWEWVEDSYGPYPRRSTDASALRHPDTSQRVLRGGSWGSNPRELRSASRHEAAPALRFNLAGFRLARTLSD